MVALALVALFGVRVETWIISDSTIRYKSSLWTKEVLFERLPGTPLTVRVEVVPCDSEETQTPFPHVIHLIGPGESEVGSGFMFRNGTTLIRFLETLHDVSPVEVEDIARISDATTNHLPGPDDLAR